MLLFQVSIVHLSFYLLVFALVRRVLVELEHLLCVEAVVVIANDHALILAGNSAFVADVRSC